MKSKKDLIITVVAAVFIYISFRVFDSDILMDVAVFAVSGEWGDRNIISAIFPYDSFQTAVLAAVAVLVYVIPKEKFRISDILFSSVFSFFYLIGYSFYKTDSREMLHSHPLSVILSSAAFIGTAFCMIFLISLLRKAVNYFKSYSFKLPELVYRHTFLVSWIVIFLGCIPYLVIRYPAGVEFDAYYQIEQFLGMKEFTAYSPPFSSVFMGFFVWLGKTLFDSYDIGLFILVTVQSLLCSAMLAYTAVVMKRLGVSRNWCVIVVLIYTASPIFASYITAAIKDAMFSATTALFIALMAEEILLRGTSAFHKLCTFLSAVFMCLFRNNGILYLAPFTAVFVIILIVRYAKKRKVDIKRMSVALLLCAAVLCNTVYTSVILPALDIPSAPKGESFSLPFQQTARYLKEYPDDVTEEEKEAISAVLDYENLASIYDPNLSDPVKNTFHGETKDLIPYFKAWFSQFLRHPLVYFDATLNNTIGFYYPNARNLIFYSHTWNMHELMFNVPEELREAKNDLFDYVALYESLPVLMLIGSVGSQFWAVIYLFVCAVRKKDKKLLLILIPSFISAVGCVFSPTFTINGVRYALPYIYANFMLMGIWFFRERN